MNAILTQELRVSELKRQWDAACKKFDYYGTLPALLDMMKAKDKLVAAEDELLVMKHDQQYAWHETMDCER